MPTHVSGGLDWLAFSGYGGWPGQRWGTTRDMLVTLKKQAETGQQALYESPEGELAEVQASGFSNGVRCEWSLMWKGVTIGIVDRSCSTDRKPAFFCSMPSLPLMIHGAENLYHGVLGLLKSLGFEFSHTGRPTRVDGCVDLAGVHPSWFYQQEDRGHVITRATKVKGLKEHGLGNQLEFGKRGSENVYIIFYDKWKETASKPEKIQVMRERWGGTIPEQATRVEIRFGAKSSVADRFEIKDVDDLFRKLPVVFEYLCSSWIRFTAKPVNRESKKQSVAEICPLWEAIMNGFEEWTGKPQQSWIAPERKHASDVKGLKAQAVGCLVSAYMHMEGERGTLEGFENFVDEVISEYSDKIEARIADFIKLIPARGTVRPRGFQDEAPF